MGCHPPWWEEWNKGNGWNPICYIRIPHDSMLPWTTVAFGLSFVYVQDNAMTPPPPPPPPHTHTHTHTHHTHTARDTIAFLAQQDVDVKGWPAQSPDINLILHVWDQTGVWLRDIETWMPPPPPPPCFLLCQAWGAVRPRRVRTLGESMPHCERALFAARGGHKVLVVLWHGCKHVHNTPVSYFTSCRGLFESGAQKFASCGSQPYQNCFLTTKFYLTWENWEMRNLTNNAKR